MQEHAVVFWERGVSDLFVNEVEMHVCSFLNEDLKCRALSC
jgi:hypothetical protein